MIGETILEAQGRTIKNVIAFDPYGYDQGFQLEFEDGSIISLRPILLEQFDEPRILIEK